MRKFLLPLGVAALVLSGCASGDADATEASPEVEVSTPAPTPSSEAPVEGVTGSYTFESPDGASGTLEVPGSAPADIEELRVAGGGEEVAYLTGNLDNRLGSDSFDVYQISVFDADGKEYTYAPADDYLGNFSPADSSAEVYNSYVELVNGYSTVVPAMGRQDFVMVGPLLPEQIAGVSVSSGFDDLGAQPAG